MASDIPITVGGSTKKEITITKKEITITKKKGTAEELTSTEQIELDARPLEILFEMSCGRKCGPFNLPSDVTWMVTIRAKSS